MADTKTCDECGKTVPKDEVKYWLRVTPLDEMAEALTRDDVVIPDEVYLPLRPARGEYCSCDCVATRCARLAGWPVRDIAQTQPLNLPAALPEAVILLARDRPAGFWQRLLNWPNRRPR